MWWWSSKNKTSESESEHDDADSTEATAHPAVSALLELQRASGNRAVQQLVGAGESGRTQATHDLPDEGVKSLIDSPADVKGAGVRLHTDDDAAKSADSLGAAAYTRGRDIYFGAGKYAPQTSEGRQLLAHELSHALQNEPREELSRSVTAADGVSGADPYERAVGCT